jgi:hypothetical protein
MSHSVQNFQTWKPEIDAYIQDELDQMPKSYYSEVFTVKSTNRLMLSEVDYGTFAPMLEVGEFGDAVEDEAIEGYKYAYQRRSYRKYAKFSSDLLETDQTSEVERIARSFAQSIEISRNLWIFGMFRNAWNGLFTYGDGKTLISTAHPMKNGLGTQYNTFTDGVQKALTYDNALALQDVMISTVSNAGNLMSVGAMGRNKVLFGSPYLREKMFQIAGVDSSGWKTDSADRNANYFVKGDKFDVLVLPWISYEAARRAGEVTFAKTAAANFYDSMWGIMDVELVKKFFKVYTAQGYAKFDEDTDKSNQAFIKYAYDKYAFGATGFFGLAMSKGDGTTYTG